MILRAHLNPVIRDESKTSTIECIFRNVTQQLSQRYTDATKAIDDDEEGEDSPTLLLVFGDHGMTDAGDHGGSSPQETDSFLFAQLFQKRNTRKVAADSSGSWLQQHVQRRWDRCQELDDGLCRLRACAEAIHTPPSGGSQDNTQKGNRAGEQVSAVRQIDLVPTIATVLGVPIPFSSRGRVIPELLALTGAAQDYAELAQISRCNKEQLERSAGDFACPEDILSEFDSSGGSRSDAEGQYTLLEECLAKRTKAIRAQGTEKSLPTLLVSLGVLCTVSIGAFLMLLLPSADTRFFFKPLLLRSETAIAVLTVVVLRWVAGFSNSTVVMEVDVISTMTVGWVLYWAKYQSDPLPAAQWGGSVALLVLLATMRVLMPLGRLVHTAHTSLTEPAIMRYLMVAAIGDVSSRNSSSTNVGWPTS